MRIRLPSPIVAAGPGHAVPTLGRAWLAAVLVVAFAGRVDAQSGPIIPDPDPSVGLRVEGPLLTARPPGQMPAPPTNDPGPFQAVVPGSGPATLGDAAGDGPEPIQQPLLIVPPAAPPLPPLPTVGPILPDSAFGTNRSTQIQGPVGVLGQAMGGFSEWFCDTLLWGDKPYKYVTLPSNLLWKIPLANPREPRFYGKFFNLKGKSFIDTAIGAEFGLGRIAPKDSDDEGIQLDVFGAVFTRFNERRFLTAADYRAGIPLTYKKGPWSTKLSYEHTSTHIGDEFSQNTGRRQVPLVLDETVLGVSRYFLEDQTIRLYGQYGYAFNTAKETNANKRSRFDLGISYSHYADTGPWGRPFLAYDMDLREYQNYHVNSTFQAGWQWVKSGRSARIAVEVYDGRSQFGQFFLNTEHYVGFAGYYDW
jgi:hypothetical protein